MPVLITPTTTAVPLLFLGLQKIARTPTARLPVGYRLQPRYVYGDVPVAAREYPLPWALAVRRALSLGEVWYLQRLLAGGITGEVLPLTGMDGDARPLANVAIDDTQHPPLGIFIDVWA